MEERELLCIFLTKGIGAEYFDRRRNGGDVRGAVDWVSIHHAANERYLDTLGDKRREAINFIRMLPEGEFVEGIGAWVNSRVQHVKVYIIDC